MRTTLDFSPLYRSMIGVDRMATLIEAALKSESDGNYPPCDIEKLGDDAYRISLAVAGFKPKDIEITAQPHLLVVSGHKAQREADRLYLHHGIASRSFERRFELADYVVVKSADYADGILFIDLVREVPEALKARRIEIANGDASPSQTERLEDRLSNRQAA